MAEQTTAEAIPDRTDVPAEHCWDLSKLFESEELWEDGLTRLEGMIDEVQRFRGRLEDSPQMLRECLDFNMELGLLEERLGNYAQLRASEDGGSSENEGRLSRYVNVAVRLEAAMSYQVPEIQRIPDDVMSAFLESDALSEFSIYLRKILRFRPHILGEQEERLLAMQAEFSRTSQSVFSSLTNVDMDFGEIDTPDGPKPLTQSTYNAYMIHPDRNVRRQGYLGLLREFGDHKHTLAGLYGGSVQLDIYSGKVRNYPSAIEAALFADDVPINVYENLIASVRGHLDVLHAYYEIRRRALGLDELHLYDSRVPLVPDIDRHHTYSQAVDLVMTALQPLGSEYTTVLRQGLLGRWVDRYENKGKRSGAFSWGSYVGDPYILMNFKETVFDDVFTLAHEAGHSMHSWYSVANNPFQHYDYTIFVAEVASTFNEQLLTHRLLETAEDDRFRAYLINKQIDDTIGTILRQTMFAEFEKTTHEMAESNQPLTIDALRNEYRKLLETYFGPKVRLEETSDMEGLRIPHFYDAFYVYKYATGLSAAIALAKRVLAGGKKELDQYLSFLKSGGSKYPLEQLRDAGVDMTTPGPVDAAMSAFRSNVQELGELLQPRHE